MRIVVTENCTLDGVIDLAGGWFDPMAQDEGLLEEIRSQMADEEALLLGRVTFEDLRGYWPQQHSDTTGIRDQLDRVRKYVVSRTMVEPGWANTTVLRGSPVEEIGALRDAPGRDLVVTGSISVVRQLVEADIVDEYRLFVYPLSVGSGARLFPDGLPGRRLRLAGARPFPSGVVLLRYERVR